MIYILMAAVALLAIAYIVYRILDLLARRKFAQSYAAGNPTSSSTIESIHPTRSRQGAIPIARRRIKTKESAKS